MGDALCQGNFTNCPLSTDEGAATQVYLATADVRDLSGVNGAFFEHCSPIASVRDLMVASVGEAETIEYQQQVFDLASSWTLPTCPSWVGHVSGSGLCAPSHAGACYVPSTESASGLAEWKATHTELPTQCLVSSALLDYMCP